VVGAASPAVGLFALGADRAADVTAARDAAAASALTGMIAGGSPTRSTTSESRAA
jgi:hypothetical protein